MAKTSDPKQPKWLAPVSYLAALPVASAIIVLRDEPWTKGSFAGLVIAACMGVGVVYVSAKNALGLPIWKQEPTGYGSLSKGWLDRPWGIVLQLAIVGCVGVGLALI